MKVKFCSIGTSTYIYFLDVFSDKKYFNVSLHSRNVDKYRYPSSAFLLFNILSLLPRLSLSLNIVLLSPFLFSLKRLLHARIQRIVIHVRYVLIPYQWKSYFIKLRLLCRVHFYPYWQWTLIRKDVVSFS